MRTAAGTGRPEGGEQDQSGEVEGWREGLGRGGGGVSDGTEVEGCNRWNRVNLIFATNSHPHALCVGLLAFTNTETAQHCVSGLM